MDCPRLGSGGKRSVLPREVARRKRDSGRRLSPRVLLGQPCGLLSSSRACSIARAGQDQTAWLAPTQEKDSEAPRSRVGRHSIPQPVANSEATVPSSLLLHRGLHRLPHVLICPLAIEEVDVNPLGRTRVSVAHQIREHDTAHALGDQDAGKRVSEAVERDLRAQAVKPSRLEGGLPRFLTLLGLSAVPVLLGNTKSSGAENFDASLCRRRIDDISSPIGTRRTAFGVFGATSCPSLIWWRMWISLFFRSTSRQRVRGVRRCAGRRKRLS